MVAYKTVVTLGKDQSLTLRELPFPAGEQVEIIVLGRSEGRGAPTFPLRGKPVRYVDPTAPVATQDWGAFSDPA